MPRHWRRRPFEQAEAERWARMAMSEPTGGAVECQAGECDGELIAPDHARWVCGGCGETRHYRCVDGGVPVRDADQLRHACGGRFECHWHADENQGSLFS